MKLDLALKGRKQGRGGIGERYTELPVSQRTSIRGETSVRQANHFHPVFQTHHLTLQLGTVPIFYKLPGWRSRPSRLHLWHYRQEVNNRVDLLHRGGGCGHGCRILRLLPCWMRRTRYRLTELNRAPHVSLLVEDEKTDPRKSGFSQRPINVPDFHKFPRGIVSELISRQVEPVVAG
jgi:hypothetical protein